MKHDLLFLSKGDDTLSPGLYLTSSSMHLLLCIIDVLSAMGILNKEMYSIFLFLVSMRITLQHAGREAHLAGCLEYRWP